MTDPDTTAPVTIHPDLATGSLGFTDAALRLAEGGLRVVPMTSQPTSRKPNEPASKNPGGLLGKGWQTKTSTDPEKIREWFDPVDPTQATGASMLAAAASDFYREVPYESMVLGIHTGPNLVVLDIDDWADVPEQYRAELQDAAVPFQSSSSTDPMRGHYLFAPRDGFRYGAGALKAETPGGNSPGEVRHGNSIIVSSPSVHAKANLGRRYEWQRTGTPPVMSEELANWCGRNANSKGASWQEATWLGNDLVFDTASADVVESFMTNCTASNYPEIVSDHVDYMTRLADSEGLHGAFLGPLVDMMKFAAFGFVSAHDAATVSMAKFIELRTDQSRAALGGNVSDEPAATKEFLDLLQWAIGKTVAQVHLDADALEYEAFEQVAQYYVPGLPVPERPEYLPEVIPPNTLKQANRTIFYEGDREPVSSTHASVSAALIKHCVDRMRYCTDMGTWFIYDREEMLWRGGKDQDNVAAAIVAEMLVTRIQPVTEMTFGKAIHQAGLAHDDRESQRLTALVAVTGASMSDTYAVSNDVWAESNTARAGIMAILKTERELHVRSTDFDNQPDRMAVANGVLDLSPLAAPMPAIPILLEDSPEHLITFRSSTVYDPKAKAPEWNKLIESAFDDPLINPFLATWFGLCIDNTKNFGKFLLAHGKSHSGKGMIFGLGSSLVFGNPRKGNSLVASIDKNLIVKSGVDMTGHRRRVIADLRGKAMGYIDESGDGGSIDTDYLKSYCGGMPQQAERKYENPTSVDVPPLVVSSNHEWRLGDVDAGTSNRVISLHFAYGHGAGAPPNRPDDPHLPAKLTAEASGILNWALEGYMRWVQGGRDLIIPASVQAQTDEMNAQASEFGTYLDNALDNTGDPSDSVLFRDIWTGWDNPDHGYKAENLTRGMNVSPKAVRLMRKSIEEHLASWGDKVMITGKNARVQEIVGVKLSEQGQKWVTGNTAWLAGLGGPL